MRPQRVPPTMPPPDLGIRVVIIGNSGSGKSTLAQRIADRLALPVLDLDLIHWEGEGYGRKRAEGVAQTLAAEAAGGPRWIIEGVYGWLASAALPRAESLIWLDLPWSECRDGLIARGMRRGADSGDFAALLAWAEGYWTRATSSSFQGHRMLFDTFARPKQRLRARGEVLELIARLPTSEAEPD